MTLGLPSRLRKLSAAELVIISLFVLSLPFVGAKIDWDGTGYYGYLRSVMFDHNLQFKSDWTADTKPVGAVGLGKKGLPHGIPITKTGHLANYLSVGPAILWAPFVGATRAGELLLHHGKDIPGDGHGLPYARAVCLASALYAFLGLWISFRLARNFVEEKWALLATIAIWFASSLTLYMYADPSWAHADCVFAVALFLWYWYRTRESRAAGQWAIWGLLSGLMCDVYFPNSVFVLLPAVELVLELRKSDDRFAAIRSSLVRGLVFAGAFIVAFSPTLIVRQIIFGNPLSTGAYGSQGWNWTSPKFLNILFASSHGLFTTTPVLLISVAGLVLSWRSHRSVAWRLTLLAVAFWCLIAVYPWWNGLVSFGNRFFVSLTPVFVIGLAVAFSKTTAIWHDSRAAMRRAAVISALLIIWNMGLVFQLDHGLFMQIGPTDWQIAEYNQFRRVPGMVVQEIAAKFSSRTDLRERAQSN